MVGGAVAPQLIAGGGVQRIDVTVVGADIDDPIGHRGRGNHIVTVLV